MPFGFKDCLLVEKKYKKRHFSKYSHKYRQLFETYKEGSDEKYLLIFY